MVKYGEELLTRKVPEWRNYYVNYDTLKEFLREMGSQEDYHARFLRELGNNTLRLSFFYKRQEQTCVEGVEEFLCDEDVLC